MIARTVAGGRQSAVRVTPPTGFPPGTSWVKRTTAADRRGGAKQYGTPDPGDAESRVDVHPGTLRVGLEILTMPTAAYEIHIRGRIPPDQLEEFENLRCVTVEPALTVLRGRIPDQAALHGVLIRVHSLGLELLEIRRLPETDGLLENAERTRG